MAAAENETVTEEAKTTGQASLEASSTARRTPSSSDGREADKRGEEGREGEADANLEGGVTET